MEVGPSCHVTTSTCDMTKTLDKRHGYELVSKEGDVRVKKTHASVVDEWEWGGPLST